MPLSIVIIGKPGSGKGTHSAYLEQKYGFVHISTGEILREHMKTENSFFGKKIRSYMENNEFIPDDLIADILSTHLRDLRQNGHDNFVFDGFPRTVDQIDVLDKMLIASGLEPIKFALHLSLENKIASERLSSRFDQENRPEDSNKRAICKRLIDYRKKTVPVVEDYILQRRIHTLSSKVIPQVVQVDIDTIIKYYTNTYTLSM